VETEPEGEFDFDELLKEDEVPVRQDEPDDNRGQRGRPLRSQILQSQNSCDLGAEIGPVKQGISEHINDSPALRRESSPRMILGAKRGS